jgi:hypothetical protein
MIFNLVGKNRDNNKKRLLGQWSVIVKKLKKKIPYVKCLTTEIKNILKTIPNIHWKKEANLTRKAQKR